MAIELVTGKKGTVHVDSADDGALYAACADRGSDITIDTESYLVAWNGDAGWRAR